MHRRGINDSLTVVTLDMAKYRVDMRLLFNHIDNLEWIQQYQNHEWIVGELRGIEFQYEQWSREMDMVSTCKPLVAVRASKHNAAFEWKDFQPLMPKSRTSTPLLNPKIETPQPSLETHTLPSKTHHGDTLPPISSILQGVAAFDSVQDTVGL
ncbi:uncharacterized protein BDZ99DRAFT_305314 [Mytilinidion resinicola]|uniref:Uncharacterized protein n=1 Tax=Mytilinidion resinicola TaxID=574789 RepID=A0A6A6YN14_9PEZI|nr:uncharacterized protein BDZ99DRAFT_305314 [Mytilinidion resinicola]KAF2810131.1 hypothetical protein BDZ99DRAFT_305314 [Mytilinidion resinicola]